MALQRKFTNLTCDVLIAGGGPAGVSAALAAARYGAKVILCQNRPVLGGNASSEIRMHIVGADSNGYRCGFPLEVEAREGGIVEEIRLHQAASNPIRSPHLLDLTLYDLVRREKNLKLLLETHVVDAVVEEGKIVSAKALREGTEEEFEIVASHFIDATGDSRLAVAAGNPFTMGRESRFEYNESHAREIADKQTLGSTILFQAIDTGRPVPFRAPPWARRFTEEDLRLRPHGHAGGMAAGEKSDLGYGYWWLEWGGNLDTISDNEEIRENLLSIALGIWDHIKNSGDHGADNWALSWVGSIPGKRESRRLQGRQVLTEQDVLEARDAPDAIAYGGWFIDLHPPQGVDAPKEAPSVHIPVPHLYSIPLRCCCSGVLENLFFAGRNISATHVAFASTRVMATCAVIGQGVGIAAACAAKRDLTISQLLDSPSVVAEIQQTILKNDGFLIGIQNEDPADLVHQARATASSQQPGGEADLVRNGYTRSVHGERGVKPGKTPPGTHRWMSDPADGLPATLTLSWEQPVEIATIHLVFDTGMHRWLSLTQNEDAHSKNIWGPQPETIRDYKVHGIRPDGSVQEIVSVEGNYQRLVRHQIEPLQVTQLRLEILATNGIDHARVIEIRCYRPEAS